MARNRHGRFENGTALGLRNIERPEIRAAVRKIGRADAAAGFDAVQRFAQFTEQPNRAQAGVTDREISLGVDP
jgi:hypothetical protein